MAKNTKTKRTELKDMSISEKNMTKQEMENVQGGYVLGYLKGASVPLAPLPPPPKT